MAADMASKDSAVATEARRAVAALVDELAQFCVEYGISAAEVERMFRRRAVAFHTKQLEGAALPATVARLREVSGFPSGVVQEALSHAHDAPLAREDVGTVAEDDRAEQLSTLVSMWMSNSDFTAFYGVPLDLPFRRGSNGVPTFQDLVSASTRGIAIEQALDQLREDGVVEVVDDGQKVRLIRGAVSYKDLEARSVARFGRIVTGLMRNLRTNRQNRELPEMDKLWERTFVTDLPIADVRVADFKQEVWESGDKWILGLNHSQRSFFADRFQSGKKYGICCFMFDVDGTSVEPVDGEVIDLVAAHDRPAQGA